MTTICCISDTHNKHKDVIIPKCDILFHAGDATSQGYLKEISNFAEWFATQPAKHRICIPGNHDFGYQNNVDNIENIFDNLDVTLLIDEATTVEGLKIWGTPWQPWFHNWAYNFPQYDKISGYVAKNKWAEIPNDTDIILVHGPPYMALDKVLRPYEGEDPHVGCPHLRERILEIKPKLVVCGHIHEGYGRTYINDTLVVNASICTLDYKPYNKPIMIEL